MRYLKIIFMGVISSALILNQMAIADINVYKAVSKSSTATQVNSNIVNTDIAASNLEAEKLEQANQQIIATIHELISEKKAEQKAAPTIGISERLSIDLGVEMVIASVVCYVTGVGAEMNADVNTATSQFAEFSKTIHYAEKNTLFLVAMDGKKLTLTEKNPAQLQELKNLLKQAGKVYAPHIYLTGSETPESVGSIIKLATNSDTVYEPAHSPVKMIVAAIKKHVKPGAHINISVATLPDIKSASPELKAEILTILSRINFVNPDGSMMHVDYRDNALHFSYHNLLYAKENFFEKVSTKGLNADQILAILRSHVTHIDEKINALRINKSIVSPQNPPAKVNVEKAQSPINRDYHDDTLPHRVDPKR